MTETRDQRKIAAAIELGFIADSQIQLVEHEAGKSKFSALEIAIRKGYLDRKQLEVLQVFADPLDVVPGYRIDGLIGRGGVGIVFKATQIRMDRPVAIKTISQAATRNELTPKRFEREARIVGQLGHPNIISAIDFGVHNDQLFLVMEFVDGVDAEKYLEREKQVPEFKAWYMARQVAHALENAYQLGITHRDIKPGNLILTKAPSGSPIPPQVPFVKIADFGLAKFKDSPTDAAITIDQSISGTPFYMSPEQVQAKDIDHRSDIYSLGITIWHLITGSPPIDGVTPFDVINKKMNREDEWMTDVPHEFSAAGFQLLKKMCRHDRELRINDYSELNSEIDSVLETLTSVDPLKAEEFHSVEQPFFVSADVTLIHERPDTFINGVQQDTNSETQDFKSMVSPAAVVASRRRSPALVASVLGILILIGGIYAYSNWQDKKLFLPSAKNNDLVSPKVPLTRLDELAGPPMYLFNGTEVDPTQKFAGTWEVAKGGEGEAVLAGSGTRIFRCRDNDRNPLRYFRFVCGFRHHEAETIAFRQLGDEGNLLFEVDISMSQAVLKVGDTESRGHQLRKFDKQSFGYHLFRIESQPDHWRVELDSSLLGEIPKPDGFNDTCSIQLVSAGKGKAHFEQIRFQQLRQ